MWLNIPATGEFECETGRKKCGQLSQNGTKINLKVKNKVIINIKIGIELIKVINKIDGVKI